MTIYYLCVKTHKATGVKYLCQTTKKDPYTYLGSGTYWLLHLRKHGRNIDTEILRECSSSDELKHWGQYYSTLWNVVDSPEWANLKPETGQGGSINLGPKMGKANGRYDHTIYQFKHTSGLIESCTRQDFIKTHDVDAGHIHRVIKGKLHSHKGWSVS